MLRRELMSLATALAFLLPSGRVVAQETAAVGAVEERTEEIVVTGTRIRRKDLTTPAPVTVINRDQITASGKVSIGDFLQALPEQGNAINTGVNNGGDGATRVNLRGVGVSRTLVLVNGRRWFPGGTGADGSADLNSIPTQAVERIEILKDGASAVYGSDAIAGVVNIITRKGGGPTEASVLSGVSGEGDGNTIDVNLTTGTSGERGNLVFSAGYFDQKKVMAGDRVFSAVPGAFDSSIGFYSFGSGTPPPGRTFTAGVSGTGTQLWQDLVATGESSFIWDANAPLCGTSASGDSNCFRAYAGSGLDPGQDGYNFAPDNYLVTPQQRISLYSAGDIQLGSIARGFFEASYVNRQSGQDLAPEPLVLTTEGIQVSGDSIYNPFGVDVFTNRRMTEFGTRQFRQDIDSFRVVAGVDGTLPEVAGPLSGWFWDMSYNYGRTAAVSTKFGNLFRPALAAAVGPSMLVGGVPTCVSTPGDPTTAIDGCVPLNLYGGPNSVTTSATATPTDPDQVSSLLFRGTARGTNELKSFQVNTSGELFTLMADRPVGLALGYENRSLSGEFINDPITEKGLTTGNKGLDTRGSYSVNELYGELSIPLVSGMMAAQDLEATAAVRWFDYSNFGSDTTYKFGGRWRPIADLTVRGTYSTAFRAPSISDLFLGRADNFPSLKDPCRGPQAPFNGPALLEADGVTPTALGAICQGQGIDLATGSQDTSSQLRSTVGGNDQLGPETAKIYTVGLVLEPRWVKNLSVTVDYYNMDIEDSISSFGENVILGGCYDGSNPAFCNLVQRDPSTDFIINILNLNANVGRLQTAGIDFSVRYALPTPTFGRFAFALDASWLQKIDQTLADGTVVEGKNTFDLNTLNSFGQSGGTFPAWKFNAGVTWGLGGLGAGISSRFLGSFEECGEDVGGSGDFAGAGLCYVDSTYKRDVSSYHSEDVFVSYTFGSVAGKTNFMVGVQNAFDVEPAKIYNGFASLTDQYNYDQMGRFFFFRLAQTY